jgi:hypothetical protein
MKADWKWNFSEELLQQLLPSTWMSATNNKNGAESDDNEESTSSSSTIATQPCISSVLSSNSSNVHHPLFEYELDDELGATASASLQFSSFKLIVTGPNSSGNYKLALGKIELYGKFIQNTSDDMENEHINSFKTLVRVALCDGIMAQSESSCLNLLRKQYMITTKHYKMILEEMGIPSMLMSASGGNSLLQSEAYKFPYYWGNIDPDAASSSEAVFTELPPTSALFKRVSNLFYEKGTNPGRGNNTHLKIKSIEYIRNAANWRSFCFFREQMRKNAEFVHEETCEGGSPLYIHGVNNNMYTADEYLFVRRPLSFYNPNNRATLKSAQVEQVKGPWECKDMFDAEDSSGIDAISAGEEEEARQAREYAFNLTYDKLIIDKKAAASRMDEKKSAVKSAPSVPANYLAPLATSQFDGANETLAWHGTHPDYVPQIATRGFRREFTTTAAYGDGVYFAVNANYSVSSSYAKIGNDGKTQKVFLCRVLTGVRCQGSSGMSKPASRRHNPRKSFDSFSDNPPNPSVLVIFNDHQVYPEFVVTFQDSAYQ